MNICKHLWTYRERYSIFCISICKIDRAYFSHFRLNIWYSIFSRTIPQTFFYRLGGTVRPGVIIVILNDITHVCVMVMLMYIFSFATYVLLDIFV